jgi:GTP-binding protein
VTPLDSHFASLLRQIGKPVVLLANKAEGKAGEAGVLESYALGFGDPLAISAEHGEGLGDLYDVIAANEPEEERAPEPEEEEGAEAGEGAHTERTIQVAIVGRPNVGKSTLVNRIVGEERMLTGPEAGITRDAIAIDWQWRGRSFRLVDTAGLRRKARVEGKLEKLAVGDTLRAIRFSEVSILVLDITQPFEKQDLQIADLIEKEGRAIVIALDKWDLVDDRPAKLRELREEAERLLPQIRGVPLVPVSGLTGEGVDKLLAEVLRVYDVWNRRVPTAALNRWIAAMVERHPPPAISGRRIKLRYLTQAKARPPSFIAFCSRPESLPDAYTRYLVNSLRDDFKFPGVPIRLTLRKGDNPFEGRKKKA